MNELDHLDSDQIRKALLNILEDERLAQESLRQSEERLRLSTELANVAVWEYNFITNSMSRSRNHDKLYGLDWQTHWDLNTFTNATHPDDQEYSNNRILKSVAPGGPDQYTFDFRVVHPDQSIHWLMVVGQVIERNSEGQGIIVRGCLIDITKRKQAEDALRRSEAQLRENNISLIRLLTHREPNLESRPIVLDEQAPLRILYLENDPNDVVLVEEILHSSQIAYHLTHVEDRASYTSALAKPDFDIIILDFHLHDIDGLQALELAQNAAPEIPVIVFTGSSTDVDISKMMTAGAWNYVTKDHPKRLMAAINQAIERKRFLDEQLLSENVLRKNQERFQSLIEHSADGIAMFDDSSKILYSSSSTNKILGYSVKEFEGNNILDYIHTEDQPYAKVRLAECITKPETASNIVVRIKHKDSSWRYIEMVFTNLLSVTSIGAIVCNYRDITERKHAEEEIKLINEELHTINKIIITSASALDLKFILDNIMDETMQVVGLEGGTICLINPDDTFDLAVERGASQETIDDLSKHKIKIGECLCGNCAKDCKSLILQTKEDVLEYATREVLRGEDIRFHAAFPFVVGKKCVGVLCVFTRTDKKPSERTLKLLETIVAQTAIAIENAKLYEEVKKHTSQLEQIVTERTAELQLANKELEAFSYSVSHDLRAPLRAIDGFSLALLEDYANILDEQGKQFLQRVRNGATEMAELIDDMLNLSRISRRELVSGNVDLSELIKSIAGKLAPLEPKRKVQFEIAEKVFVNGDRNLLKIALENLLNNAWKFTSKKKNTKIEFGVLEKEGKNVYFIKDNGVGFDMKYSDKLFAPFQRLHKKEEYPGTGIGLATVKRILAKHGGTIWAESEIGKGTVFYFTI